MEIRGFPAILLVRFNNTAFDSVGTLGSIETPVEQSGAFYMLFFLILWNSRNE